MTMSIHLPRDVQEVIEDHCFSRLDVEVGGFLVGTIDADGTHVVAAHPALAAQSGQTNLTFTHETWDEVLQVLESDFQGQSIVGWYHSHPGFGVFLSDYDIFIQENFFGSSGQVALVVDPLSGTYGFLTAREGAAIEEELGNTLRAPEGHSGADKVDAVSAADQVTGRRTRVLPVVLVALVVGLLAAAAGWFTGSVQGQSEATAAAQARTTALERQVVDLQGQLDAATSQTQPLPEPSPTTAPTPTPIPAPTPTPVGPQTGDVVLVTVEHTLAEGETIWSVASFYLGAGEKFPTIVEANPGLDPDNLLPGQVIRIPLSGILTSESGVQ